MTEVLVGYENSVVAELGPGTGPMTASIQQRLGSAGRHVAVELNSEFARTLALRFPEVQVVCDSATSLPSILQDSELPKADAVISGLPFAAFPVGLQRDVLDAVVASVDPADGVFTTFTYIGAYSMPSARRFRGMLRNRFAKVSISRPVLRNLPPAYVLTARGVRS
jgi:phosphatidylethanolamine/phosphatidyl-N-methylethanolamine N-methyltransferase